MLGELPLVLSLGQSCDLAIFLSRQLLVPCYHISLESPRMSKYRDVGTRLLHIWSCEGTDSKWEAGEGAGKGIGR